MSNGNADPVMAAAMRLEAAVDRLASALSRPRAAGATGGEGMPRAEVEAISARLDAALSRLRGVLREQAAAEDQAGEDQTGEDSGAEQEE